jgi:hypothetical protein
LPVFLCLPKKVVIFWYEEFFSYYAVHGFEWLQ